MQATSTMPTDLDETLRDQLLGYGGSRNRWPNDDDVRSAVLHRKMPTYVQRLVSVAIECALLHRYASHQQIPDGLEVEHLKPQRWNDND